MLSIGAIAAKVFGRSNDRKVKTYRPKVEAINALEPEMVRLTDAELRARTQKFRKQLAEGVPLDDLLVPAFATVREAAKRALGQRHFDVQLIGGMVLHQGKIAEMKTGEGKTLVATLPVYLNALTGRGVHVVTVNDYLAKRDAEWMGTIYKFLGLSVGVIVHVIGSGIGSTTAYTELDYQTFIFPGIVCMSVIFSSVFYGSYIIWDRKFDFLKSVMVAPVDRGIVFTGKTFGGMTNSLVQAFILLIVGALIGIQFTAISLLQTVAVVLLFSFALTSLGLALGSYMHSLEGFQMIVSFVVMPLFFLSGALFPLDNLPEWLSFLTMLDPATYAVDALRNTIIGIRGSYTFEVDIGILTLFTTGLGTFGVYSFGRMKAV